MLSGQLNIDQKAMFYYVICTTAKMNYLSSANVAYIQTEFFSKTLVGRRICIYLFILLRYHIEV